MTEPTVLPDWHRPGFCDWDGEDLRAQGHRRSDARFCGGACRGEYARWKAAMEDGSEYTEPPARRAHRRSKRRPRPGATIYLSSAEISGVISRRTPITVVDKVIEARRRAEGKRRDFDRRR